jgi:hypothetical protein
MSLADVPFSSSKPNLCTLHVLLTILTFGHTLGDAGPSIMSLASSQSCHLNAIDVGRMCASFEEGSDPQR